MIKKIKIKILKPVAGKFGLSANINEVIDIEAKQATVMIESGYAEEVKKAKRVKQKVNS